MPLPGGGCVAVQRIPSSDLATFVDRAVDGMLLSPGGLRNFRDEPCLVSRDESGDKTNHVIACPFKLLLMKSTLESGDLQTMCGPSGSNMTPMVTDTKLGGISLAKQHLRSTRIGLLMMVVCAFVHGHIEKHGGDGLSWLASWLRQKEIDEHDRTSIEMRCFIEWNIGPAQFSLFGLNGNCCPVDCLDC